MLKCLGVALVLAAVLVPTAAARSHHSALKLGLLSLPTAKLVPAAAAKPHHSTLKLALVPLPKAKLGSAAAGLHIALGSGPQYGDYPGAATGYALDYGSIFLANPGLDEVTTGVEVYKSARAAKRAVNHDKKNDFGSSSIFGNLTQLNLTASEEPLVLAPVGDHGWATLISLSVVNYGSVYLVEDEFSDGKYVLNLAVAAGSQDLATSYAASKARMLDRRLHLGLSGRLHGHPVRLPKSRDPGPPASGLDPKTAALQTSDLPGSAIYGDGYGSVFGALSSYEVDFEPAGPFDDASQIIGVMPSTNSAGFVTGFLGAEFVAFGVSQPGGGSVAPVDVSAVGDEAQAAIVSNSDPDGVNIAVVTLHSGAVSDVVIAESSAAIDPVDVQTLAQSAATRLDAALT
jgi:hypothetical protein